MNGVAAILFVCALSVAPKDCGPGKGAAVHVHAPRFACGQAGRVTPDTPMGGMQGQTLRMVCKRRA